MISTKLLKKSHSGYDEIFDQINIFKIYDNKNPPVAPQR